MGRNIGKDISKNLSIKYSQKPLDHTKLFATDALKTASKRLVQKSAEATGDLLGNKIADKITKLYHRIIQKQMKKKYLEKGIYLQN